MAVKDVKTPSPGANSKNTKTPQRVGSDTWKDERPSPFSIEGIRSGAVQSKLFKGLIIASGVVMAGGFIMTSLNPLGNTGGGRTASPINTSETVAQVGDQTVTRGQLENVFARQQQFNEMYGQKTTVASYLQSKNQALQGLTDNASLIVTAKKLGITVSNDDIEKDIDKRISDDLKPQQGQTEAAFRRLIEAKFGSMDEAKAKARENYDSSEVRDNIEKKLLVDKLEKSIKDGNKVSEDDYKRSVTKLKLWEIVLRPALPKGNTKDPVAEQKQNIAKNDERVTKIYAALKAKPTLANFKATAQKDSDDAATKTKGGDFGWKLPKEIMPADWGEPLSKSASNLVTPFKDTGGAQTIFFIESRKTELPKDYAKNKKKLIADFETEQDNAVWTKKQGELQKMTAPAIEDPALLAFSSLNAPDFFTKTPDAQKQAREAALVQFKDALGKARGENAAAINYQIAQINGALGHKPDQLVALQAAVKAAPDDADLGLETARSLREAGQTKPALAQLKAASKTLDEAPPSQPSPFGGGDPSAATRAQIAAEYDLLKQKDLATAERKKIKPAAPGGMGGLPPGVQIMPQQR